MANKLINKENIMKVLDVLYDKSKEGIPYVSVPVNEMAEQYLKKYPTKDQACKMMFNTQIAKCTTSGFITGFGGFITLPIAIPANISSVLYVQMRMIACAACISGYDLEDDEVQTFVYACLAGVSVNQLVKKFGVELGEKLVVKGIEKIPGKVLTKINQFIGFRFITKFGEKGLINLGKMVPVVGAVINGGFDLVETKIIADRAYKMFIKDDFSVGKEILESEITEFNEAQNSGENHADLSQFDNADTDKVPDDSYNESIIDDADNEICDTEAHQADKDDSPDGENTPEQEDISNNE